MKKKLIRAETAKVFSTCKECYETIDEGAIKLKVFSLVNENLRNFGNYHLACYNPEFKQYISKNDIEIRLDPENTKILNEWIKEWNKNYVVPPPIFSKLVESQPSKHRRSWLEIFKFLDALDVFKVYSYINKEFYHISWDEELWHFFCRRDYENAILDYQKKNFRSQYVILCTESCIWCHSIKDKENFERCPLIGKPLCRECKNLERFKVVCKGDILHKFNINPNILNLKFAEGCYGQKVTYRYMVEEAFITFRKRNKEVLLSRLRKINYDSALIDFIETIEINSIGDVSFTCNFNLAREENTKRMCENYIKYRFYQKKLFQRLKIDKLID